ncbi:MAG: alkaline phosphatase [Lautropia sp.]
MDSGQRTRNTLGEGRRAWLKAGLPLASAVCAAQSLSACRSAGTLAGGDDPFTLGVASGFPSPDGVVLWTRLAPDPSTPDGGLGPRAVDVDWIVAEDERLRTVVAKGRVRTGAPDAHAVHVEVRGLRPARRYWYRFRTGAHESPLGRTQSLPAPASMPSRLRLAIASCQQYEHGYYSAYRHIVADEPDLLVHLGDYIYEESWGRDPVRHHGAGEAMTLADYRARHMLYKRDPDLQAAHAAMPWALTWDDHEVSNDYANEVAAKGMGPKAFLARRAAAYRAWYEHMPAPSRMKPRGAALDLYGGFSIGRLATIDLLDARQYRSPHACPPAGRAAGANLVDPTACPQLGDAARTMLGAPQERWLDARLRDRDTRWNLIGQQTLFAPNARPASGGRRLRHTDGWDGYPAARERLLGAIERHRVPNPVVLGGDVHAFYAARLDASDGRPLASEFVGTSITSQSGPRAHFDRIRAANPHILHADGSQRGYLRITLDAKRLRADMIGLDSARRRESVASVQRAFVVESGRAGPVDA